MEIVSIIIGLFVCALAMWAVINVLDQVEGVPITEERVKNPRLILGERYK